MKSQPHHETRQVVRRRKTIKHSPVLRQVKKALCRWQVSDCGLCSFSASAVRLSNGGGPTNFPKSKIPACSELPPNDLGVNRHWHSSKQEWYEHLGCFHIQCIVLTKPLDILRLFSLRGGDQEG
jgi:hypothetical protein